MITCASQSSHFESIRQYFHTSQHDTFKGNQRESAKSRYSRDSTNQLTQALWSENDWIASSAAWVLVRRAVRSKVQFVREEFLINDSHTFTPSFWIGSINIDCIGIRPIGMNWVHTLQSYRGTVNSKWKWKSISNHCNWQLFSHRTLCWMIFFFLINFLFCANYVWNHWFEYTFLSHRPKKYQSVQVYTR